MHGQQGGHLTSGYGKRGSWGSTDLECGDSLSVRGGRSSICRASGGWGENETARRCDPLPDILRCQFTPPSGTQRPGLRPYPVPTWGSGSCSVYSTHTHTHTHTHTLAHIRGWRAHSIIAYTNISAASHLDSSKSEMNRDLGKISHHPAAAGIK